MRQAEWSQSLGTKRENELVVKREKETDIMEERRDN